MQHIHVQRWTPLCFHCTRVYKNPFIPHTEVCAIATHGINTGKSTYLRRCPWFSSHPANVRLIGQRRIMQPRTISFLSFYKAGEKSCVCAVTVARPVNVYARIEGDREVHIGTDVHAAHADVKATGGPWKANGVLFTRRVVGTRRSIENRPARASD